MKTYTFDGIKVGILESDDIFDSYKSRMYHWIPNHKQCIKREIIKNYSMRSYGLGDYVDGTVRDRKAEFPDTKCYYIYL